MHILSLLEPPPPHESQLLSPHLDNLLHHRLVVRLLHPDLDQPRHRGQPLAERLHPLLVLHLDTLLGDAQLHLLTGSTNLLVQQLWSKVSFNTVRTIIYHDSNLGIFDKKKTNF